MGGPREIEALSIFLSGIHEIKFAHEISYLGN